jgi:hypothetical protein
MTITTAMHWRYRIGVAGALDRDGVVAVRRAAYRQATEFDWNDEALLGWCAADDEGAVLAVWDHEGTVMSTVRASVFTQVEPAENFLEYSLAGIPVATPTLVLSRAATDPNAARQGLNSVLRYAYLCAVASTSIRSVITIVYDGGPRLASMRSAGFDFHEPRAGWDTEAVALTRPLLAALPRERLVTALGTMSESLAQRLTDVRIEKVSIARSMRRQFEPVDALDDA